MVNRIFNRADLFARRTWRAWCYWRRLDYSWHLAWAKAGMSCGLGKPE